MYIVVYAHAYTWSAAINFYIEKIKYQTSNEKV